MTDQTQTNPGEFASQPSGQGMNTNPGGSATDKQDEPQVKNRLAGAIADDGKKPIERVLHDCRRTFYIAFAVTAVVDLLSLAPMLFMMNVMDHAIGAKSNVTLISLTAVMIGLYVFWAAIEWIRDRLLTRLSLRIDWDLSADIFDASFRRHVGRKNVNVHQLLGDLSTVRQFLTGPGLLAIIDAPFAILFIGVGALFSPFIALFALIATVIMLLLGYSTQKVTTPVLKVATDAQTEAARIANNSLRHAESTLALGMMGAARQRWYRQHHKYLLNQVNASEASSLAGGLSSFFSKGMSSMQMALGAFLAIEGIITGGAVIAINMLLSKSIAPIQKLLGGWGGLVAAHQSYERLNALLISDAKRQTRMQLPPVVGALTVAKASAVPPGHNKAVLFDIDFQIKPGEVLAIVGPSAAGKTCLARMLIGVWKPVRGSVRLDGVEISDWDHDEFGPQIGYVPQEIEFFEGSVAENIARLGEIDPEKVVQAAKLLGMHEVILAFPKGYDTELGESGFALSGGQRQRLAICRAIYGMPKFIVMDEPNANLDDVGEGALVNAISYLKSQGCAVVITTHRPRLVGAADNLLVLRNGTQVGFGPAEEMINAVRNLKLVDPAKPPSSSEPVDGVSTLKEGTSNTAMPSSGPSSSPP